MPEPTGADRPRAVPAAPAPSADLRRAAAAVGAGLLGATAAIHLYLYFDGYSTIRVIGWLFLLQAASGIALALALLATLGWTVTHRAVAALGAGFAAVTLGGYLLSIWVGLFGFEEVFTWAGLAAGLVEVAAIGVLGSLALLAPATTSGVERRLGAPEQPSRARTPGTRRRVGALAGSSFVALALLGGTLISAATTTVAQRPDGLLALGTRRIEGSLVLTDARGFTLYWFAKDTPTASHCYGTCARYWPPVLGRPERPAGVTGTLGTVRRSGGALQATYDHHPLYTYVGDSAPGQDNGNGIFLDGGLWHQVTVGT